MITRLECVIMCSCAPHAAILGYFWVFSGVRPRVLGHFECISAVCLVWISFDFHTWAYLFVVITRCECVITHCKSTHALLSRAICTFLDVLMGVLGAYRCISDIRFAKIKFHFFTKLDPSLMNEDRSNKSLILSNDCLEWAIYHYDISYFIKLGYDLMTQWSVLISVRVF